MYPLNLDGPQLRTRLASQAAPIGSAVTSPAATRGYGCRIPASSSWMWITRPLYGR